MNKKYPLLFFCLLLLFSTAHAQLSIGVNAGIGNTFSKSKQLEFNNDNLHRRNFLSNYLLGVYGQQRFGAWAASLGVNYHQQTLKFDDPNTSYFSGGTQTLMLKQRSSSVQLSLGGKRFFPLSPKLEAYGGLSFVIDFYNSGNSNSSTVVNYNLIGATTLNTSAGVASGTGLGLVPELGLSFKAGERSSIIFFGQFNIGLNETLRGTVTRDVIVNQVPQGSYSSNSHGTSFGMKYQYNLKAKSEEEKQREAIAKAEKQKAREEAEKRARDEKALLKKGKEDHESKKVTYDANGMPEKLDNRKIEKQNEVIVRSTTIEFLVWDDKQEDKDSISLYINGEWVLKEYEIVKNKKVVRVTIDPDKDNYLIMYALNEGKFPPNTCAISINDGVSGEKRLNLKSSLTSCGAIQFKYKPKE